MEKTVLMVDDAINWCHRVRDRVIAQDPEITFLMAHTLQQARDVFAGHRSAIDLIIMDGRIDGEIIETLELVGEIREAGFTGPMIAASSQYNMELIHAGCTIDGDTDNLAPQILKVLSKL